MNREERRAGQKSAKRRLKWLEHEAKRDNLVKKLIDEVENNFDDSEIETAKIFLADCLTLSGPFSEAHQDETMDKTCQYYGLDVVDGFFILDAVEEIMKEGKEAPEQTQP